MTDFKVDCGDITVQMSPLEEMRKQRQKMIEEKLRQGIPVTLTMGGKKLTTFYPDGRVEDHSD